MWKKKNKLTSDSESLKIKNNLIVNMGKKTRNIRDIDGRYVGVSKISKKCLPDIMELYFENLKKNETKFRKIDMTNFFNYLIRKKFKISPIPIQGKWNEYDDIKDLKYKNI